MQVLNVVRIPVSLATVLFAVLGQQVAATETQSGTSLFDGTSFEGWEGNLKFFRIEDGAIVAGNLNTQIPRNEFLCTKQRFSDFELNLQVKVKGDGANAGIQFRSERIPNHHEVMGYQADVGKGWWAKLYDESRRKKILAAPTNKQEYEQHVKLWDWNDYRIRCEGRRVQLWINGYKTVDFTEYDDTIPGDGIIGLQIHSGPPCEAWYRNIRITDLSSNKQSASPNSDSSQVGESK